MNKKIAFIFLRKNYLIFILLGLLSCKDKIKEEKIDFKNWKTNSFKECFIKYENDTISNLIYFYDGIPSNDNFMLGYLSFQDNIIYFKSKNQKNQKFVLFNFNLKLNECENISYIKNQNIIKKYTLCNEDKFYDTVKKDTIYKFVFKDYNVFKNKTNVIYFVGKINGIVGCYLSVFDKKGNVLNSQSKGGNVYIKRYNYSNEKEFIIE